MNIDSASVAGSAEKILQAATVLFAENNFNAVSIKQIASASGVNSALISYYFGGKKNLYQEVLDCQAQIFANIIADIRQKNVSPMQKLRLYVAELTALQETNPCSIPLTFRELSTPHPVFEKYVKNKLFVLHQFMMELVEEAIACKQITTTTKPTHVAFTLESMLMFFFISSKQIKELSEYDPKEYLSQALTSYLESLV